VNLKPDFTDWLEKITELTTERRFQTAQEAKEALISETFTYDPEGRFIARPSNSLNRKLFKPPRPLTLIGLEKDRGQLRIHIPAGGLNRVDEVLNNGFGGLLSFFILFSVSIAIAGFIPHLYFLIILTTFIKLGLLAGSKTDVYLDKNICKFTHNIFGIKYSRRSYESAKIIDVFVQRTGSIFQVALQGCDRTYNLGGALKQEEAVWLAQEIREHLDL
jgi:hypothetical protein